MNNNNDMTFKGGLLTAFICILFGGNAVAIKMSLTGLGVFTCAGLRFAVAAVIIIVWAKIQKMPLAINRKQIRQTMILGAIFVVQLSLFYSGLGRTTASHGVLIANMLPFFVLILAHFFIPEDRITLKKGVGMALGFIGVVVLFFDSPDMAYDVKTGDLLILAAVVCWSISAVRVKQINSDYNFIQITLYPMMFAVPFFFIAGFLWDEQMIRTINAMVINSMLYQTFVTASFGFLVWNSLLQRYGATAMHSFVFILPLAGVFFGVLLLNEPITPYLAVSIFFIVTGVLVVNLKRKPAIVI